MDTKRLITGMALAMSVMLGWLLIVSYLDRAHPEWGIRRTPAAQQAPTTEPAATAVGPMATTTGAAAAAPGPVMPPTPPTPTTGAAPQAAFAAAQPGVRAMPATRPVAVTIGSATEKDPTYAMAIELSAVGGGIEAVTLNEFKRSVNSKDPYVFQQPYAGAENASRPLATRWISVDGVKVNLDAVPWALQGSTESSATYAIDVHDANGPAVRVIKTFALTEKKAEAANAAGYEVKVDVAVQNLSGRVVTVATAFNGTTTPPNENDSLPDQQTLGGYLKDGRIKVGHHLVTEYSTDTPTRDMTKDDDGNPVAWFGAGSGYFNALLRPEPATGASTGPYVSTVTATALKPDGTGHQRDLNLTIETQPVALAPAAAVTMPVRAFFFPKKRDLLGNDYLLAAPLAFNQTLVLTNEWCGICTFQWIIDLLVFMLRSFHVVLYDWGLAIIALVCVVRLVLHPITKKSQVSMMKMGKMGPEVERLKKKYGDDKEALNREMMRFYKEQGATPILGCLPMLLQMPIWIALYSSLQSTFELRQSPFLAFRGFHLTWIDDLAKPDRLFYFPVNAIHLPFGITIDALNILPFLLAVVFYLQQKYTPKPPATTPEQIQQQKMMQWMTLLFPVFLYNGPAGLNLYILTSTTIGIIESKIIRKHIREREAAEAAAGVVIVDAPPPDRTSPPPLGGVRRVEPKKPTGGLAGWFAALQQKAEELKREAERKK